MSSNQHIFAILPSKRKTFSILKAFICCTEQEREGKKDFHWAVFTVCYSPGAGTRVCRGLLLPPRSSLCCVFAGPACQTPTECTEDGVSWCAFVYLLVLSPPSSFIKVLLYCCHDNMKCVSYLEEMTGGDKERRVLLLVFSALFSQRRQSLQTQLADFRTHPETDVKEHKLFWQFLFCLSTGSSTAAAGKQENDSKCKKRTNLLWCGLLSI